MGKRQREREREAGRRPAAQEPKPYSARQRRRRWPHVIFIGQTKTGKSLVNVQR